MARNEQFDEVDVTGEARAGSVNTENIDISGWDWYDVTNHGVKNDASEPINSAIDSLKSDNSLLIFPQGRYLISTVIDFDGLSNFGMVGYDATFELTSDYVASGIFTSSSADPASNFLADGFTFDFTGDVAARPFTISTSDYARIQNVDVEGTYSVRGNGHGGLHPIGTEEDAVFHVNNYRLPDGSADWADAEPSGEKQPPTGIYIGSSNVGTVVFTDCVVSGWRDNGLYTSNSNGPVVVKGGVYSNNYGHNIRIGADGSRVEGATTIDDESGFSGHGLWVREGTDHVIRDLKCYHSNPDAATEVLDVHSDAGAVLIDGCYVDANNYGGALLVVGTDSPYDADTVTIRDCTFEGEMVADTERLCPLRRPTNLIGCEMNITTTSTTATYLVFVNEGATISQCNLTADIQCVRGFSAASQCKFINNRMESTDGSTEINPSGDNNIAVGNIVQNGISVTGETMANIILST